MTEPDATLPFPLSGDAGRENIAAGIYFWGSKRGLNRGSTELAEVQDAKAAKVRNAKKK